jgi:predicted DNA-binding transcriptional regulator AlpA
MKPTIHEITQQSVFLIGPDVQIRYRRSHVTIWRWQRDPKLVFPKPIQINGLNYWRLTELLAWEADQRCADRT